MSDAIERYLTELRTTLADSDSATIQDALADAEEHLRTALAQSREDQPDVPSSQALATILEQYGTAEEVAKSYQEVETRTVPLFAPRPRVDSRNPIQRFVGVLIEPRAYAALFLMLFSLITGIIYFTWAVTGISLSAGLAVTLLGLPFFGLFVFSIQGLALVEGRLIEALVGIRMPRRQALPSNKGGLWDRFKSQVKDGRTWTTILYFILKLPLGVISFSIFFTLLVYSLELLAVPVLYFYGLPFIVVSDLEFYISPILFPLFMLAGFLDLILILHLAKAVGRWYGSIAKAMLVRA